MLLACASCSFSRGAPPGLSVPGDGPPHGDSHVVHDGPADAQILPDAPPDAPPVWATVETLTVSCRGAGVQSQTTLASGVAYRLRAYGECYVNTQNNSRADADYIGYNLQNPIDVYQGTDEGIVVDNPGMTSTTTPGWGTYSTSHDYTISWTGGGGPISVAFQDVSYSDNDGTLSLDILAYQ